MTAANLDFLITLLLIDKVRSFRDSYSLIRVLAWKFGIIEFIELTRNLENEGMVKVENIKGIGNYEITVKGKLYLDRYLEETKPFILEKYPGEREFISLLFKP